MRKEYKLIFERSTQGHRAYDLPKLDVPALDNLIPANMLSDSLLPLPELAEIDIVRHYTNLSRRNFGVDNGFYPLGSCTMKYNPKINEETPKLFNNLHPYADEDCVQGALEVLASSAEMLAEISGMDACCMQPSAGAHGELLGIMLIKAYHESKNDLDRKVIIVPDAAHGTNPATAAMAGFKIKEIKSAKDGGVDLDALRAAVGSDTAGLMLTNPSTLGLFEKNITEVAKIVHDAGGLLYYDGANLNAIMGVVRPGDMGFDVMHFNLHKTFSTPHGGGGPGSGPVAVKKKLIPFLPKPVVTRTDNGIMLDYDRPQSIGRVKSFFGNFGVVVRAYTYMLSLGAEGVREAAQMAVLNANYIKSRLKGVYNIPFDRICMHEFVVTPNDAMTANHVSTMDVAKSLIDRGYHPPTIYFPLIVHEAMMIEPTETESKETLDEFIAVMKEIAHDGETNPELLHNAPITTPVGRPDDVKAARNPVVKYEG